MFSHMHACKCALKPIKSRFFSACVISDYFSFFWMLSMIISMADMKQIAPSRRWGLSEWAALGRRKT
jgi:hypothetical protein